MNKEDSRQMLAEMIADLKQLKETIEEMKKPKQPKWLAILSPFRTRPQRS